MRRYYVNNQAQANGDHEVHREECVYLPKNLSFLGTFSSCKGAVDAAKKMYPRANGCKYCANDCHTS